MFQCGRRAPDEHAVEQYLRHRAGTQTIQPGDTPQHPNAPMIPGLGRVKRAELDGEFVFAGIAIANQLGRADIQVLLGDLDALP